MDNCLSLDREYSLHEVDFLRRYIFHHPDFHQHQDLKYGDGQAWDSPKTHWEYSRMLVEPFARKYFLHENWHSRAKYSSSHQDFVNFQPWNWGGEKPGREWKCLRVFQNGRTPLCDKIFPAWKLTFSREIFLITSRFHHLWNVKLGAGGPGRGLDCPTSIPGHP